MRVSEIKTGNLYGNGSGKVRKVIGQTDDKVTYETVQDGTQGNKTAGQQKEMTLKYFAKWSVEGIESIVELVCLKDWELDGETYLKAGETYTGEFKKDAIRNGIHTFEVKDKNGKKMSFHSGSDYFTIR